MRRFESRSEQTIRAAARVSTSVRTSVDLTQTSGPRRSGSRGVATAAPSSSRPEISRVRQPGDVLLDRRRPGLLDDRHPGEAGVDVRHRRRARVEAARVGGRRVVRDVHLEDVLVGEPAGLRRQQLGQELAPHVEEAEARRGEQVLDRPAGDEVDAERAGVEVDRADRLVASRRGRARPRRGRAARSPRHRDGGPVRYEIVVQQTSAVRSSIASAKRSGGIEPSASGRTCTTSAPRSSWACAIWPTVGNSYSLITIRSAARSRSSALTIPLTPCVTEVVTASSAGSAWRSRANAARAASARSTQTSHSAPFSSQPSRYSSYACRTRCESAPCEHELT